MSHQPKRELAPAGGMLRRWGSGAVGLGLIAIAAGVWLNWPRDGEPRLPTVPQAASLPPPAMPDSPYRNTGPDAKYVGSKACLECHSEIHESFHQTSMGRSMAEVDPDREPADATFDHPLSQRRYEVFRRDGKLWHRESLLTAKSESHPLGEYPLKYVVGSGHHSRTYLVEVDGFLVESPLTYYTSLQAWKMSPGYDKPEHFGFQREADEQCLDCHAARAKAVEGSLNRIEVIEPAISCERCHGPGSLHVAHQRGGGRATASGEQDFDQTIVNPSRLTRELAEAICQQCHLQGRASIPVRGRRPTDFRPGLPLQDFRVDYRLKERDGEMTVVGHVEQMHLSDCYTKSETLTCTTCHDPHTQPSPQDSAAHYRASCLKCHADSTCTADRLERVKISPVDDCTVCHMPRSKTDIPHLAFTHHRIGIHGEASARDVAAASSVTPELEPVLELSRLGEVDRRRLLGLAYLELANTAESAEQIPDLRRHALELLSEAKSAGIDDSLVEASLARLHFDLQTGNHLPFAERALQDAALNPNDRCNSLFLRAHALVHDGRPADALPILRQLTRLRRLAVDWLAIAHCEEALGRLADRNAALQQAVRINPLLKEVHRTLADEFRRAGDADRAEWHAKRAAP